MFLTTTPVTGMTEILAASETATSLLGSVFTAITGNALLAFFAFCGVFAAGVGLFITLKGAAR